MIEEKEKGDAQQAQKHLLLALAETADIESFVRGAREAYAVLHRGGKEGEAAESDAGRPYSVRAIAERIGRAFEKFSPEARAAVRVFDLIDTFMFSHATDGECDDLLNFVELEERVDDPAIDRWLAGFADALELVTSRS